MSFGVRERASGIPESVSPFRVTSAPSRQDKEVLDGDRFCRGEPDEILARPVILSPARMAEVGLLLAVVAVPILIGVGMSYLRRPWWWGAVAAICIFLVAALAPPPEEGESRVALGDIGFLVIVAAIVALLVWIGSWLTGRIRRKSASTS